MIIGNIPEKIYSYKTIFVSGIDTNIGKTFATGHLANRIKNDDINVITQKLIQTGCKDISEDIEMHREIMQSTLNEDDKNGLTCPIIFSYPSSPHLAAELDDVEIDLSVITNATLELNEKYDLVLLEGAGGLMVPFTNDNKFPLGGYLTIDYIKDNNLPVILVTSGKLGSINHTLLSIDACRHRDIKIELIIYNLFPNTDNLITTNTLKYLKSLDIPVVLLQNTDEE